MDKETRKGCDVMRRRRVLEPQPKRVRWLKLLCAFAAGMLAVLLLALPVQAMFWHVPRNLAPLAAAPQTQTQQLLDAPYIDQRDKYPTGCESVTAVMALQYLGVDLTVEEFIDGYLPQGNAPHLDESGCMVGANPWEAFLGSPYSEEGWGCYAPVIAKALEEILADRGLDELAVLEPDGQSVEDLCQDYVDQGVPVLLWATIDMEEPVPANQYYLEDTWELFTWIYPLHCLLLTGEDEDYYYFNDPMVGKNVPYEKADVETAYEGIGEQAVVVLPLS